jgi:putative MFS transporter
MPARYRYQPAGDSRGTSVQEFLKDRSSVWLFAAGSAAVTAGVLLHLPMFWMGRHMGFRMVGMPMDPGMITGMYMIVGGVALAAWGLLPKRVAQQVAAARHISVAAPEDAPLSAAHWQLMGVLVIALIIDVMKPASLGFIMPGMTAEYGVPRAVAALVPFAALAGTVTGSVLWGVVADIYGRKATIMLAAPCPRSNGTSSCAS